MGADSNQTEGPWDEVMRVIGMAHTMLHEKGVVRIQTDIRVGSRFVLFLDYFCFLLGLF